MVAATEAMVSRLSVRIVSAPWTPVDVAVPTIDRAAQLLKLGGRARRGSGPAGSRRQPLILCDMAISLTWQDGRAVVQV